MAEWLGHPTTWIYAEQLSPAGILAGLSAGRVSVSACPAGPRLWLHAPGEEETTLQGTTVRSDLLELEVRVEEAAGQWLRLATRHGVLCSVRIPAARWTHPVEVDMRRHGYLRAEVRVPDTRGRTPVARLPVAALTNPVWHAGFLGPRGESR
ncbi:MAG: hypothetical protein ACP5G2_08540 [Candidatus Bipolaricaulaceae bacterium]